MKSKILLAIILILTADLLAQKPQAQNVILITMDGMRWQDIFRGADSTFFKTTKALGRLQAEGKVLAR